MIRRSKQFTAILLSLLLVLLPMQSAFAGLVKPDSSRDHAMHSQMDMSPSDIVSMSDCDSHHECSGNTFCEDNGCSSGHCASCVTGVLSDTKIFFGNPNLSDRTWQNFSVTANSTKTLYRPPRA